MQSPSAIELSQSSSMLAQLDSEGTDTSGYPRGPWSEPADVWLAGTHEPLQSPIVVRPCLSACAHLCSLTHSRARTHTRAHARTLSHSPYFFRESERDIRERQRDILMSLSLSLSHTFSLSPSVVFSLSPARSPFFPLSFVHVDARVYMNECVRACVRACSCACLHVCTSTCVCGGRDMCRCTRRE